MVEREREADGLRPPLVTSRPFSSLHLPFPTSLPIVSTSTTYREGRFPSIVAPSYRHKGSLPSFCLPLIFAQTDSPHLPSSTVFRDSHIHPSNIAQPSLSSIAYPSTFHNTRTSHLPVHASAPVSPSMLQVGNVCLPISSSSKLPNMSAVTPTQASLPFPPPAFTTQSNSLLSEQQTHHSTTTNGLFNDLSKTLPPWVNSQVFLPSLAFQEMLQKNISDRGNSSSNGLSCLQRSGLTIPPLQPLPLPSTYTAPSLPSPAPLSSSAPPLLSTSPIPPTSFISQPPPTLPARVIPPSSDRQHSHLHYSRQHNASNQNNSYGQKFKLSTFF